MLRNKPDSVDLLVLGAGWTSTFLLPALDEKNIKHAETTTTGRDGTIPFQFDPNSADYEPYKRLPSASTVLITFPLTGHGQSKHLTSLYRSVHGDINQWIQLGSTGIFNQGADWISEESKYDQTNSRAIAEDELRHCVEGCVLNLAGLYGGERNPANWLPRVAKCKDDVRQKKAVHMIHGRDVARAVIATHHAFTPSARWIIADLRVYDWWDLILSFSTASSRDKSGNLQEKETNLQYGKWVSELMQEENVRALPRDLSTLGRKLDSRAFWKAMGIWPQHGRLA